MTPQEYAQLLRDNPEIVVTDDGSGRRHGPALTPRLTEVRDPHPTRPAPTPTEHDEQVALFAWVAANEAQQPALAMLAAVPNGGYRPMTTAAMLKAEGVQAGYPDILLDVARGRFHGLRIELKRADHSNHATPAQQDWIARLRSHGYMAVVCYGCDEAVAVITAYLGMEGSAA